MTPSLEVIFGELGIAQYLDIFLDQGFDTWETILDITESDLDALGVKLGHRRKLQRRIANCRGIAPDASLVSPTQPAGDELKPSQEAIKTEPSVVETRDTTVGVVVTKRKYRRHPKPDENAPERPPSAYVLFSNKMREELKGRNLSFTEIAKLVGENWQNLTAAEKEPFESQAQAIKEKYLADLAEYKKTPEYRKYMTYLQEFKTKHATPSQDKDASKRVRLSDAGSQRRASPSAPPTRSSRSGSGAESRRGSEPPSGRQRVSSMVSSNDSQYTSSLPPSTTITSPESSVFSPVVSDAGRLSADSSPTVKQEFRDQHPLPGPRHSSQDENQNREQLSMHRHLPSLSDVFDGQGLPGGMRPPNEPNGYRFSGAHVGNPGAPLGHRPSDGRPIPLTNGQPYNNGNGHPSPRSPFGQPRPPVDGPLPIHALLTSKPEPTFHTNHAPSHLQHGNPYHADQRPMPPPPMLDGAPPMVNGYHHHPPPPQSRSHHHALPNGHHQVNHGFHPPPSQLNPPPHVEVPQPAKQNANLDGMSALLKAGEIVDRRAQ